MCVVIAMESSAGVPGEMAPTRRLRHAVVCASNFNRSMEVHLETSLVNSRPCRPAPTAPTRASLACWSKQFARLPL